MTKEVLTRDLSSGKIHRRIQTEGGFASLEADNLDQAGEFEVITLADALDDTDRNALCVRCFPPTSVPDEDNA